MEDTFKQSVEHAQQVKADFSITEYTDPQSVVRALLTQVPFCQWVQDVHHGERRYVRATLKAIVRSGANEDMKAKLDTFSASLRTAIKKAHEGISDINTLLSRLKVLEARFGAILQLETIDVAVSISTDFSFLETLVGLGPEQFAKVISWECFALFKRLAPYEDFIDETSTSAGLAQWYDKSVSSGRSWLSPYSLSASNGSSSVPDTSGCSFCGPAASYGSSHARYKILATHQASCESARVSKGSLSLLDDPAAASGSSCLCCGPLEAPQALSRNADVNAARFGLRSRSTRDGAGAAADDVRRGMLKPVPCWIPVLALIADRNRGEGCLWDKGCEE